jgi:ankyrin repeat protein
LQIAGLLLDRGADLARVDDRGMTALHYLTLMYAEEPALLETLLAFMAKGADPNVVNSGGTTPLMFAAYRNRLQLATYLLSAGADPNAMAEDGHTALSIAREHGHAEVARLLERGNR